MNEIAIVFFFVKPLVIINYYKLIIINVILVPNMRVLLLRTLFIFLVSFRC